MTEALHLLIDKNRDYKLTRLNSKNFAQEIITESQKNILKDYIYVETRRIIA